MTAVSVVLHRGLGRSCKLLTVTPIDGESARDFCKQIEQDIPIWEAEIYRDKPALARGESAITEFRNWAQQSYAGAPR